MTSDYSPEKSMINCPNSHLKGSSDAHFTQVDMII